LDNLESKVDKLLETLKKIMDENDSNVISSTVRYLNKKIVIIFK